MYTYMVVYVCMRNLCVCVQRLGKTTTRRVMMFVGYSTLIEKIRPTSAFVNDQLAEAKQAHNTDICKHTN